MRLSVMLSCFVVSLSFLGLACRDDATLDPEPEECLAPLEPCAGACVDTTRDPAHCGGCDEACLEGASCVGGACVPEGEAPCDVGWLRCGAACVSSASDPAHCGACDKACDDGESCVDGSCVGKACGDGETLCDGACVDTRESEEHCGGCDQPCDTGERCEAGACLPEGEGSCTGDEILCDGECVDIQSDAQRCGSCDRSCEAEQTCVSGTCEYLPCEGARERCDGLCVDTEEDGEHCGACNNPCPGTSICIEGSCQCPGGLELCAESCVDVWQSAEHCGACDEACPAPDERIASASCAWGQCVIDCRAEYGDCDDDSSNGCEVDLLTSTSHCGWCGNDCLALEKAGPGTACEAGTCKLTCQAGFANCDDDPNNGCESDLGSASTCGSCQNDCTQLPGVATVACNAGACVIESCLPGSEDADEDPENGCEASSPPPSCAGGGDGRDDCGLDEDDDCCATLLVTGGTFNRTNNASAPATVSNFHLDKHMVTVGRYRRYYEEALSKGWRPNAGDGKHVHVHGGKGTQTNADSGNPTYETGWDPAWDTHLGPEPTSGNWLAGNENLPMNYVNWYEAYAFCIWDGGFLATEAEWNFAAACGSDQRLYPWGNDPPTAAHAVYSGSGGPQPVGSKPTGAGCFGHLDLAGNGHEWLADGSGTFLVPCVDCNGVLQSNLRGPRGGNYNSQASALQTTYRSLNNNPSNRTTSFNIRCARSP